MAYCESGNEVCAFFTVIEIYKTETCTHDFRNLTQKLHIHNFLCMHTSSFSEESAERFMHKRLCQLFGNHTVMTSLQKVTVTDLKLVQHIIAVKSQLVIFISNN